MGRTAGHEVVDRLQAEKAPVVEGVAGFRIDFAGDLAATVIDRAVDAGCDIAVDGSCVD